MPAWLCTEGLYYEKTDIHHATRIQIEFDEEFLKIRFSNREQTIALTALKWGFEYAGVVRGDLKDGTHFEIRDREAVVRLKEKLQVRNFKNGIPTRKFWIAFGIIIAAAVFFGGIYKLSRPVSSFIAKQFSLRWEERIGSALSWNEHFEICRSHETERVFKTLINQSRAPIPDGIQIEVIAMPIENAFTLPGGRIFLTDKLLNQVKTPEELLGVLGHEMGHVSHRHVLSNIIRGMGLTGLMHFLFTNVSGLMPIDPDSASKLIQLKFDREDELEADSFAARFLSQNGISVSELSHFFERLSKSENGLEATELISTHPMSLERKRRLEELALPPPPSGFKLAIPKDDWEIVKRACSSKK